MILDEVDLARDEAQFLAELEAWCGRELARMLESREDTLARLHGLFGVPGGEPR